MLYHWLFDKVHYGHNQCLKLIHSALTQLQMKKHHHPKMICTKIDCLVDIRIASIQRIIFLPIHNDSIDYYCHHDYLKTEDSYLIFHIALVQDVIYHSYSDSTNLYQALLSSQLECCSCKQEHNNFAVVVVLSRYYNDFDRHLKMKMICSILHPNPNSISLQFQAKPIDSFSTQ